MSAKMLIYIYLLDNRYCFTVELNTTSHSCRSHTVCEHVAHRVSFSDKSNSKCVLIFQIFTKFAKFPNKDMASEGKRPP